MEEHEGKIENQDKKDDNFSDSLSVPIVNDLTPPPDDAPLVAEPEQPEKVIVEVSSQTDSEQTVNTIGDNDLKEAPSVEPVSDEGLAPVNQPPELQIIGEEQVMPADDPSRGQSQVGNTVSSAVVGVAASQMNNQPHRNNKRFAVVVTVLVALLLAGVAVYVYLTAGSNTEETIVNTLNSSEQVISQQNQAVQPTTPVEVDSVVADIETIMNGVDDESDFADVELADTKLDL